MGVDVRAEPIVLTVPVIETKRYFSVQLIVGFSSCDQSLRAKVLPGKHRNPPLTCIFNPLGSRGVPHFLASGETSAIVVLWRFRSMTEPESMRAEKTAARVAGTIALVCSRLGGNPAPLLVPQPATSEAVSAQVNANPRKPWCSSAFLLEI
jgi:hypothetical protein